MSLGGISSIKYPNISCRMCQKSPTFNRSGESEPLAMPAAGYAYANHNIYNSPTQKHNFEPLSNSAKTALSQYSHHNQKMVPPLAPPLL